MDLLNYDSDSPTIYFELNPYRKYTYFDSLENDFQDSLDKNSGIYSVDSLEIEEWTDESIDSIEFYSDFDSEISESQFLSLESRDNNIGKNCDLKVNSNCKGIGIAHIGCQHVTSAQYHQEKSIENTFNCSNVVDFLISFGNFF